MITCKSLLGIVVREIGHEGQNLQITSKLMGWVNIANGGKSLHIAFGDIDAVMFQGFQEG